ncbi:hypothetical protein ABK040_013306 [Willaertia magna]
MEQLPDEIILHILTFTISSFEDNNELLNFLLIAKKFYFFLEEYLENIYFKKRVTNKFLNFCRWNEIVNIYKKNSFSYRILYFKLNNFWKKKLQVYNKKFINLTLPCKNISLFIQIIGDCKVGKKLFCNNLLKENFKNTNFKKMFHLTNYEMFTILHCQLYNLNEPIYSGFNIVKVLIFDLTNLNSFTKLKNKISSLEFKSNPILFIGTNKDKINEIKVTKEMVLNLMNNYFSNYLILEPWYFEVSNIEDNNFEFILEEMIRQVAFKMSYTNWNKVVLKALCKESLNEFIDVNVCDGDDITNK